MKSKIYVVEAQVASTLARLVRAKSKAAALAHAAQDFTVEYASQDTLAELLAAGVKVEDAVAMPVPEVIEGAP